MEVVGTGYEFAHNDDYDRTAHHYGNGRRHPDLRRRDRPTSWTKFVKKINPDLIGSGIKEKYQSSRRWASRSGQMHSWDYSGPYHGYDGFAIFARDMDMTLNSIRCWKEMKAPWLRPSQPESQAA